MLNDTRWNAELRGERAKRNILQLEMAKLLGIYRQTLIDIEGDVIGITKETFEDFVRTLNSVEE